MEPKKDIPDYNPDSLDLEIFSTTNPQNQPVVKKHLRWQEFLNNTYVRTSLTLTLLFFLFGSTFLIASRVSKPSFTTPSADVGYIPQAQIDLPLSTGIRSCTDVSSENEVSDFINSYCQGLFCAEQTDKDDCESVDVVILENDVLSEVSGQDGIPDCTWIEEESTCITKY